MPLFLLRLPVPRYVDKDRQRTRILDRCFDLVSEVGWQAASMRKLAKAADLSTGALYHYFPDKRAMLAALFERQVSLQARSLDDLMPEDATFSERLGSLHGFMRRHQSHLTKLTLLAIDVLRYEPDSHELMKESLLAYRAALGESLGTTESTSIEMTFSFLLGGVMHEMLAQERIDTEKQLAFMRAFGAILQPQSV